jgi:hypothetical protein
MSFLGGKVPAAAVPTQLNSVNVDQSCYGNPVPLVYGVPRCKMTLGWYGAFTSTPQYASNGGKGGKGPPTSYNYSASAVMIVCEGPVNPPLQIWKDKDLTTLATEGLTFFSGAGGQTAWPYLTSNFPSQAVPYDHTAYAAEANIQLGGSAAMPNYTFEIPGFFSGGGTPISFTAALSIGAISATLTSAVLANGVWDIHFSSNESRTCTVSGTSITWDSTMGLIFAATNAGTAGGYDAEPSAVLFDYCTDPNHGANFSHLNPTIAGTAATSWQTYCVANGLLVSPLEDTQRSGTDFLKDMLEITNSNGIMSAGVYNIVPLGDAPVSANGRTYTPNNTPVFAFGDDDFMANNQGSNDDPVIMTRKSVTDTYNVVRIEYLDRGNSYNVALAEWTDPLDQALNGIRVMPNKTFHQICDARVAYNVAALIGQRQLYIRNTYQFSVRADYSLLEPMDLVSITDANLGVVNKLLRITETQDDENDIFTITAEEMFIGTASAPKYNFQPAQGYSANFANPPISVGTPLIFTAPPALVSAAGGYELWVAAGPASGGEYGGAQVSASMDGTTYTYLGTINGQARYGTTSGSMTTTQTSVTLVLNAGATADGLQLSNASAADFAANRALIWLDGEIIGFENVSLISAGTYTLSPISRGLFGTGPSLGVGSTHASGASWARLDEAIFKFQIDPGMIGQTIDLKLPTFNSVSRATQTLASATAYSHLITASSGNALIGGQLKLIGRGVTINGQSAFKTAATSAWDSDAYSVQGYTNGAFATFQPGQVNNQFMMGLNSDPTTDSNYTSIDYAMYSTTTGLLQAYGSGTFLAALGAYVRGDVLTVSYDGAFVRWIQNGNLLYQVPAAANLTLYLDSSFFDPGCTLNNIQFGPYGTATPVLWIARGFANVSDENVTKQGGAGSWTDTDAYSISGYPTCHIIAKANDTTHDVMIGLVAGSPPGAINYTGLTAAINLQTGGTTIIYESGTSTGVTNTFTPQDLFAITYDGSTINYLKNGVSMRTTSFTASTMYGDVVIFLPGGGVNSLEFGPGALIPLADTGQINANAATTILTSTLSGSAGTFAAPSFNGSITVGPFPVAASVILTVTGQWQFTFSGGTTTNIVLRYGISATTGTFSGALVTVDQATSANSSVNGLGPLSQEIQVSLPANTTTTYNVLSGENPDGIIGTAISISGIIKAEVIKR